VPYPSKVTTMSRQESEVLNNKYSELCQREDHMKICTSELCQHRGLGGGIRASRAQAAAPGGGRRHVAAAGGIWGRPGAGRGRLSWTGRRAAATGAGRQKAASGPVGCGRRHRFAGHCGIGGRLHLEQGCRLHRSGGSAWRRPPGHGQRWHAEEAAGPWAAMACGRGRPAVASGGTRTRPAAVHGGRLRQRTKEAAGGGRRIGAAARDV
jgi:hypothetical protein